MNRYIIYWKTFQKYKYLLSLFVRRDIKRKYKGSYLGILWSLLQPLFHMLVLTLVFSTLFNRDIENFPVYLLCGLLLFQFFSKCTNQSMRSVISAASLIKKIYLPKYITTLSSIISNFIFFLISLIVLVLIMIATQASVTWSILFAPVYLLIFFFFCCGVSLILATINVFFRDLEHIYGVFIIALHFSSAIFYPPEIIPEKYQFILILNPLYYFIDGFRDIVYFGTIPSLMNIFVCISLAFVSMIIGIVTFERCQDKFILHL